MSYGVSAQHGARVVVRCAWLLQVSEATLLPGFALRSEEQTGIK